MLFGILVWLVVGSIAGWLASVVLRKDDQQAVLFNIVAGIVGAYAGGVLIAPRLHMGVAGGYAIAILSALVIIGVYQVVTHSLERPS